MHRSLAGRQGCLSAHRPASELLRGGCGLTRFADSERPVRGRLEGAQKVLTDRMPVACFGRVFDTAGVGHDRELRLARVTYVGAVRRLDAAMRDFDSAGIP